MFVSVGEVNFFLLDGQQTDTHAAHEKITDIFFSCHLVTLKLVTSLQLQEIEQHNLSYHITCAI